MILSRPVNPRARRMHDIVASVPLFTIRTFSIEGIQLQINSAISTSNGFGIPKLTPRVVVDAVREAATRGVSFGIPNPLEVEMAELICNWMPSIEKVRMVSSGTEATMSCQIGRA